VLLNDTRPVTELAGLDPDRDWREFATNTRAWILQTYLRLKTAGCAVALRERIPGSGMAVVSASDYRKVLQRRWDTTDAMIVVTRGSERRAPRSVASRRTWTRPFKAQRGRDSCARMASSGCTTPCRTPTVRHRS
jgi:hypothetical protein